MAKNTNDPKDAALGCGFLLAIACAIAAIFLSANILHFAVIGGLIGMIIGWLGDDASSEGNRKAKPKRDEHKSYGSSNGRAREGKVIYGSAPTGSSGVVKRSRDFSRLEVPGGYVPLEVTRTEKKTKDTVTTETKIKTYIDSKEVRAVLKGEEIKVLNDGRRSR